MRFRVFKIAATVLSVMVGIASLGVAFFAYQLGLDNNVTPGPLRKTLAVVGLLIIIAPHAAVLISRLLLRSGISDFVLHKLHKWKKQPNLASVSKFPKTHSKSKFSSNSFLWCALGVIIVVICSLWYMTNGRMINFSYYSNYYDLQADGFLAGQTSLLVEPSVELLNLADPYDWHARIGINAIWDASLYQGKYYIYWGPVPALIAALVKFIKLGVIQDQFLLLFFVSGFSVVFACLLAYVRKRFFPSTPAWTLTLFILALGLSTPVFWLVNRPNVYETAIASCQFFLFLGFYGLIRGLDSSTSRWGWFLLAGVSMGAAVGCRTSIVFTIVFAVIVTLFLLAKKVYKQKKYWSDIVSLFISLILIAAGLAWFNYIRFGSFVETGLSYQLTGDALPDDLGQLFSIRYIIPNVYLSLFQPFQFTVNKFPFVIATIDNSWTRIISMPKDYYFAEQVTGILCTVPFLWFLIIPSVKMIRKGWRWIKESPDEVSFFSGAPLPQWLWVLVIGSGLVAFITNMMFVMTTMRYLADFTPIWILFTSLIVMRELDISRHSILMRNVLLSTLTILIMVTVVIALFINFMSGDRRMLNENPELYARLEQFFNR
jgi:hypothetical protein